MYVKSADGLTAIEYTVSQLRRDNPNVSFPADPVPDSTLAKWLVFPVAEAEKPEFDSIHESATYSFVGSGATWTKKWSVVGSGISDDDLREARYSDNKAYAEDLIKQASLNPAQGVTLSKRAMEKKNIKRSNAANINKPARSSDADDYLFVWIDTVYDAQDNADNSVELLDRTGLESWVPANAVWPQWTPYKP